MVHDEDRDDFIDDLSSVHLDLYKGFDEASENDLEDRRHSENEELQD